MCSQLILLELEDKGRDGGEGASMQKERQPKNIDALTMSVFPGIGSDVRSDNWTLPTQE